MHILFVDESGTPPKPNKESPRYFVVGGVIIPEAAWPRLRDAYHGLKVRHKVRGELKWRYFAPTNDDQQNPMRLFDAEKRDLIRSDIYKLMSEERALKAMACVCSCKAAYGMQNINCADDIYHGTYKPLTERMQYYLQDLKRETGQVEYGMIVADHRGIKDDERLRGHHNKLLYATSKTISTYDNLIEGLFLQSSNFSIGIQLADLVAGAVWRKFEREDSNWYNHLEPSLRRDKDGNVAGYGIIKYPKRGWV